MKCVKCGGSDGILNVYKGGTTFVHTAADDCALENAKPKVAPKKEPEKEEPKDKKHTENKKGDR